MKNHTTPKNTFEIEKTLNGGIVKQYGNFSNGNSRTLFSIKVGSITSWIKDVMIIVLLWKLISALP